MAKVKRMSRKELRQPDEVQVALSRTVVVLRKHALKIVVGVIALVAIAIIARVVSGYLASRQQDTAAEFEKAFATVRAVVSESDTPDLEALPGQTPPETFKTDKEKYAAVVERLGRFATEHEGSDLAAVAQLLVAQAKLELGDPAEAYKALSGYVDAEPDSPLAPFLLESLAQLAPRVGQAADAAKYLGRLGEAGGVFGRARAEAFLGDHYSPRVGDAKAAHKDKAKAREHYQRALQMLTADQRKVAAVEQFLHNELQRKLAFLD